MCYVILIEPVGHSAAGNKKSESCIDIPGSSEHTSLMETSVLELEKGWAGKGFKGIED